MPELKICKNCYYFCSYREIYEDEIEPENFGMCDKKYDKHVSGDSSCFLFKGKRNA